jgi:hypothetical protein
MRHRPSVRKFLQHQQDALFISLTTYSSLPTNVPEQSLHLFSSAVGVDK